eukprot:4534609-Pleurochrysis_carterae.AAC.10
MQRAEHVPIHDQTRYSPRHPRNRAEHSIQTKRRWGQVRTRLSKPAARSGMPPAVVRMHTQRATRTRPHARCPRSPACSARPCSSSCSVRSARRGGGRPPTSLTTTTTIRCRE